MQLKNEVEIQLDLGSATFMAVLFLQIMEDPLFSVPIEDTLNPNCWLTTILTDSSVKTDLLPSQYFSLGQLLLNITCISCTSPKFGDLIYSLYSPEEIGNATSKVLNILSLLRESDFFRVTTDTILAGASKQCPHNSDFDPDFTYTSLLVESGGGDYQEKNGTRDKKVVYFNVANALVSASVVLIFLVARAIARQQYRAWRHSLSGEDQARLFLREQAELLTEDNLNWSTQAMFKSEEIPRRVRFLVPLTIFLTIIIQLFGHLAILSYIDIEGQIAGESFTIRKFLVFKFIEASLRSYRNGGSEMAILLFVFTGIWPYLKLMACLTLWFVPPDRVSVTTRGTILLWLDVFAKLSMVDILATLLAVAVFLIYIGGVTERELLTGEFFATRVIVVPCAGFYCIVIAQRLTRISSTYLLNWHDQMMSSAKLKNRSFKQVDTSLETFDSVGTSERSFMHPTPKRENEQFVDEEIKSNEKIWSTGPEYIDKQVTASHFEERISVAEQIGHFEKTGNEVKKAWRPRYLARLDEVLAIEPVLELESDELFSDDAENASTKPQTGHLRRVAIGMTGFTVLMLAVIGMLLTPSISIDAKTLWGIFESGKTFDEAVAEYPLFRVICSILVGARFVLDSTKAKA